MAHCEPWTLHPDRAFPTDQTVRAISREIFGHTISLPIVSMHGHVDVGAIRRNDPFGDPAELFIIPDHYLVRMLVAQGYRHSELGVRPRDPAAPYETDHREIWRRFARNWKLFRGTPTRFWLEHELVEIFGVTQQLTEATADAIYDQLSESLAQPEYRIRPLFDRFGIETMATTDAADSDLADHRALADEGWGERVVPTFRPDALFYPDRMGWVGAIQALAERCGSPIESYPQFLSALQQRREAFVAAGARATDHGHLTANTTPLSRDDANRFFTEALGGPIDSVRSEAFAGNMLFESARMAVDDGLVMQLHPGVQRDHSPQVFDDYGSDRGFDIPVTTEYTNALAPLLGAFGMDPRFRLILFTVDETTYSRELAPLAGAYPAVRLGAPWWFLDSPGAMTRFRAAATETAGFYKSSGFVDDTRAFASIPARHDLSRRVDAGFLATLVAEHRLTLDEAIETAIDLSYTIPVKSYAIRSPTVRLAAPPLPTTF